MKFVKLAIVWAGLLGTALSGAENKTRPSATCAACHTAQANTAPHTGMGRALERGSDAKILQAHPELKTSIGGYRYRIQREGDQSVYEVTDGTRTIRVPLQWAFGQGSAGQTYVFERDGKFYESRVSFYDALNGLDLTMGAHNKQPASLEEAAGRLLDSGSTQECFGCHSTGSVVKGALHLERLTPGVQCGRCHEGSEAHLQAVGSADARTAGMRKLGAMTTEEMSDFCGQCHRTWAQIATEGPKNVNNVRFQPYRLTNSRCYDSVDQRIRCTSCHDPHREVETAPAAYDSKCLACHAQATTAKNGKQCPVAKENCASCHMPKIELPGAHKKFTDHLIRVVKPNEPYPI